MAGEINLHVFDKGDISAQPKGIWLTRRAEPVLEPEVRISVRRDVLRASVSGH